MELDGAGVAIGDRPGAEGVGVAGGHGHRLHQVADLAGVAGRVGDRGGGAAGAVPVGAGGVASAPPELVPNDQWVSVAFAAGQLSKEGSRTADVIEGGGLPGKTWI